MEKAIFYQTQLKTKLSGTRAWFCLFLLSLSFSYNALNANAENNVELVFEQLKHQKTKDIAGAQAELQILSSQVSSFTPLQKAKYRYYLAHSKSMSGDFDAAEKMLLKNIDSVKDSKWLAISNSLLSNVYAFKNQYAKSFEHLKVAQSLIAEEDSKDYFYFSVLQHAFNIYSESGLYVKALDVSRLLNKDSTKDAPYWRCASYAYLAVSEIKTNQLAMAESSVNSGLKECAEIDNNLGIYFVTELQAELLILQGKATKALALLSSTKTEAKKVGYILIDIRYDLRLGEAYLRLKKFAEARENIESAYKLAKALGDKNHVRKAAKLLAMVASEQKNFETSVKYYNEFIELEKQFKLQVAKRQLAYYRTQKR